MKSVPGISLSILSADFSRLREDIREVESEIDFIHVDVMDGQFVPNITFGVPVVEGLSRSTTVPLDCHLMTREPERHVEVFAKAGAAVVTIHVEATTHVQKTLASIRNSGKRAGIALCPHTPEQVLRYLLGDLDVITVMSVNPGFGGQAFLPATLDKVASIRRMIDECGHAIRLEVDGGINADTTEDVVRAGADLLVVGSAVFASPDRRALLARIRDAARRGATGAREGVASARRP